MFELAFTERRLLGAWGDAREAALADGAAGTEVERFEAAAARHVSELAEALADRAYEPQPVFRVEIAESGGGTRRLAVPSLGIGPLSGHCSPNWTLSSTRCSCRGASPAGAGLA
jgi:hypothetical protein